MTRSQNCGSDSLVGAWIVVLDGLVNIVCRNLLFIFIKACFVSICQVVFIIYTNLGNLCRRFNEINAISDTESDLLQMKSIIFCYPIYSYMGINALITLILLT